MSSQPPGRAAPVATPAVELDAHWLAADAVAAAVVHGMLVQPTQADVTSALESRDFAGAIAAANACLRWIAGCREMLRGGAARAGLEVDLLIAAGPPDASIDAMDTLSPRAAATESEARRALALVEDAERALAEELPLLLPVRRTPSGHRPAVELVSQIERLRHRLGLPPFDWEAWIG